MNQNRLPRSFRRCRFLECPAGEQTLEISLLDLSETADLQSLGGCQLVGCLEKYRGSADEEKSDRCH